MRDSFVVHKEYISDLPESLKAEFLMHIFTYAIEGEEPVFEGEELICELKQTIWLKIKRRLDTDMAKYDARVANLKRGREKKEAEPPACTETQMPQDASDTERNTSERASDTERESQCTESEHKPLRSDSVNVFDTVFVNVSDTENVCVSDTESVAPAPHASPGPRTTHKLSRFVRPTLDLITEYCKERGNNVDAERFFDFYESKGWRVGKDPMKDWKAAVRNWERGSAKPQPQKQMVRELPPDRLFL